MTIIVRWTTIVILSLFVIWVLFVAGLIARLLIIPIRGVERLERIVDFFSNNWNPSALYFIKRYVLESVDEGCDIALLTICKRYGKRLKKMERHIKSRRFFHDYKCLKKIGDSFTYVKHCKCHMDNIIASW